MDQQLELETKTPWVLVSSLNESATADDLARITPAVKEIVDEWQSKGTMIWSGGFNDNKTSMAIFEGTKEQADAIFAKYEKACSGILTYALYQWDAMPILSILSKN